MSESNPFPSSSGPGNLADGDQYRGYYIPANIVGEEQELWGQHETDRFAHAVGEICPEF